MVEEKLRVHFGGYLGKAWQNVLGSSRSLDDCNRDTAGVGPTTRCVDAGGDSAYRAHLHSFAYSRYRTIPSRGPDCLDSAHPCDYLGSRHPHKRWNEACCTVECLTVNGQPDLRHLLSVGYPLAIHVRGSEIELIATQ